MSLMLDVNFWDLDFELFKVWIHFEINFTIVINKFLNNCATSTVFEIIMWFFQSKSSKCIDTNILAN